MSDDAIVDGPKVADRVQNELMTALGELREANQGLKHTREQLLDRIAQLSRENAELLFDKREIEVQLIKTAGKPRRQRQVRPPSGLEARPESRPQTSTDG